MGEQRGSIAILHTMAVRTASGLGPAAHSRLALVGARHRAVEARGVRLKSDPGDQGSTQVSGDSGPLGTGQLPARSQRAQFDAHQPRERDPMVGNPFWINCSAIEPISSTVERLILQGFPTPREHAAGS